MKEGNKLDYAVGGYKRVMFACALAAGVAVFLSMLAIVVDTVLRYQFNNPLTVVGEVVTYYVIVGITLIPAGWILLEEGHVRINVFVDRLGVPKRRVVNTLTAVLGLFCSVILIWQGWIMAWDAIGLSFTTRSLLPMFPAYLAIPLGGITLFFAFIVKITEYWRSGRSSTSEVERLGNS